MTDPLERRLDALGPSPAPPPPAAFLALVARRRAQRRATRVLGAIAVVATAVTLATFYRAAPSYPATPLIRVSHVPDTSVAALARANAGRSADNLVLPEAASASGEDPVKPGMLRSPAELERWLAQ